LRYRMARVDIDIRPVYSIRCQQCAVSDGKSAEHFQCRSPEAEESLAD
jgi:hypothetical protein